MIHLLFNLVVDANPSLMSYVLCKSFYFRYSIMKLRWLVALPLEYLKVDSQSYKNCFTMLPYIFTSYQLILHLIYKYRMHRELELNG